MAHSFRNILVHCVFSTHERRSVIPSDLQSKLSKFIAGIGARHNIPVLEVGGTENHLHVFIALPGDLPIAKAVQILKANSSRWIGEHGINFAWQEGYGAFSVSASQREAVRAYIRNQGEHHKKRSFEDEFISILRKSNITYDPQYVFG
ncbi:MAG TPA: IS200/IS605 family transposase [Terriglobales bacterium]|nr:IS200/IS605 family transposase [Terriglobales bacterium]